MQARSDFWLFLWRQACVFSCWKSCCQQWALVRLSTCELFQETNIYYLILTENMKQIVARSRFAPWTMSAFSYLFNWFLGPKTHFLPPGKIPHLLKNCSSNWNPVSESKTSWNIKLFIERTCHKTFKRWPTLRKSGNSKWISNKQLENILWWFLCLSEELV